LGSAGVVYKYTSILVYCRAAASVGLSTREVGIMSGWRRGDVEVYESDIVRACNREYVEPAQRLLCHREVW
jgi:hypothetical protein